MKWRSNVAMMAFFVVVTSCEKVKNCTSNCLRPNEIDAYKGKFNNVRLKQTIKHFKGNESSWVENIKNHLDQMGFYMNILKRDHEKLLNVTAELKFIDKKTYLGQPISLFALLKRSAQDWPKVVVLMKSLSGGFIYDSSNSTLARLHRGYEFHLPNIQDLNTGYRGLARLMSVYDIELDSIAGYQENLFTAKDFLGFAKHFCSDMIFEKCQEWLGKVQQKKDITHFDDIPEEEFLELSLTTNCVHGNQTAANIIFQELIQRKSRTTEFSDLEIFVNNMVNRYNNQCEIKNKDYNKFKQDNLKKFNYVDPELQDKRFIAWKNIKNFHRSLQPQLLELCRSAAVYNVTARLLRCRYVHYGRPHLRIGPFKMEEFHIDPPILMFHEVISDTEISLMKEYGWNIMYKAKVLKDNGTEVVSAVDTDFRTNEQGWIGDDKVAVAGALRRRVAAMTGWRLPRSEPCQIACYGPAGEFNPHIDALDEEVFALRPEFADYSVAMFYISDVGAGGHTIFPALNVSLAPRRGSAAVWFNRRPDGSPDMESLHGGCPVLEGYKWVINSWFHIGPQDFPRCASSESQINTSFRYFYI